MEFKVKEVGSPENKSKQEIEEQLLESSEQEPQEEAPQQEAPQQEAPQEEGLKEEDVLSFIKNKYKKDLTSFDELFTEKEDLPEDVSALLNYKKETGRGIEDFMKIQKDYDNVKTL